MIPDYLKAFFLAWFFTTNEPVQETLEKICFWLTTRFPLITPIVEFIYDVLSCPYCLTFWLTLIWTLNFWYALIGSFVMWCLKKFIFKF